MIKLILYILTGLVAAIFLLTYAANNLSQPSNLLVFTGIVEGILALLLLGIIARYLFNQLKSN
jgi:hypothetical protein